MNLDIFQTGLYFNKGKIVSHRSLIKIFLNPILRYIFGKAIGSIIENNKFKGYRLINQTEPKGFAFKINFKYDKRIKK